MSAPLSLDVFLAELHAMNSKVQVIAQRLKIIERNEEIIGKTLISHNKVLKELEAVVGNLKAGGAGALAAPGAAEVQPVFEEFKKALAANQSLFAALKDEADENRAELEKMKSELLEVKYVVENLNPVAYVTADQVGDLVDERISKAMRKEKKTQ